MAICTTLQEEQHEKEGVVFQYSCNSCFETLEPEVAETSSIVLLLSAHERLNLTVASGIIRTPCVLLRPGGHQHHGGP